MVSIDDIKKFLEQAGFELQSIEGHYIQIYTHQEHSIVVKIEDKSKKKVY